MALPLLPFPLALVIPLSVDVPGARVGLLAVALGLFHRAQVLELAVEEPLQLRAEGGLARFARECARYLAASIPDRLPVAIVHRDPAQSPDAGAVDPGGSSRAERARGCLVEGRELVGEAGHRAADACSAGDHAATHVVDRAALRDVALDDRPPAAEVDQALLVALLLCEDALLVVTGS